MDRNSSDKDIFESCRKGKKEAFQLLYNRHSAWMLGVCMRYCRSKEDAEDVLQDGLVKLFSAIRGFEWKHEAMFRSWMKRIMVNTALNYIRDNYQPNVFSIDDSDYLLDSNTEEEDSRPEQNIDPGILLGHIQSMPEGYRAVFNLYVFEKFSHKEIAAELKISESTSKTQLLKARKYLKKKVCEETKKSIVA